MTNNGIQDCKKYSDENGRLLIVDLLISNTIYTIVNVYCPAKNNEEKQVKFFENTLKELNDFDLNYVIMGGDFNIYMDEMDKSTKNNKKITSIRVE